MNEGIIKDHRNAEDLRDDYIKRGYKASVKRLKLEDC
jgi:hypothetical protein